ncbi:Putative heterokaryon incompatibility [Septoria linicola]|uniref:Heterokaryon incompatibility n=1 Tax=Septoria linicola TaxID=215465 RepID=A0A9Q9EJW8_9PEZI|nr:putative heterokaryon incompatibility [Septoria linicola]USW52649.1 Putative heterokaryon incompatibility [Septoria linicola]
MLFQYAQLGSNTIRLVRFSSRSTLLDLHVNIEHQANYSEQDVHYSVLSYQIHPELERTGLTLNGRTRMIDNHALRALQAVWKDHKDGDRFWLDALSVNQADPYEVREQKKQLSSVYASADQVLLWLAAENAEAGSNVLAKRAALYVQDAADGGALCMARKLLVLSGDQSCTLETTQQTARQAGSL